MVLAAFVSTIFHSSPITIGFLIAMGSTTAKTIHYYVSYYGSRVLNENTRRRLEDYGRRVGKVGALILFLASASPIPDDPIVVAMGVAKYNPIKFFAAFFAGKVLITTLGALMGNALGQVLTVNLGDFGTAIVSAMLTVLMTVILIKVDLEKLVERAWSRLQKRKFELILYGESPIYYTHLFPLIQDLSFEWAHASIGCPVA